MELLEYYKEKVKHCLSECDGACHLHNNGNCECEDANVLEHLQELEKYKSIGTVEDCKESVERMKPNKAEFVDTRFRHHGKNVSDGCSLDKCYKCPNCNSHIFHVFDSESHCKFCGQSIDWNESEEQNADT